MNEAIAIIDALQAKYQRKLIEAAPDTEERRKWEAFCSALTLAAMELEKAKGGRR